MIEIIKAYIAGKTIEYRVNNTSDDWIPKNPYHGDISFYPNDYEYRIKPETVVRYVLAAHFEDAIKEGNFCLVRPYMHHGNSGNSKVIKLTFQDNVLTKAEVLNP